MISNSQQPDPIDKLLDHITKEAIKDDQQQLATFFQRVIARIVDTAIVVAIAYGAQLLFVQFVRNNNTYNVDYMVKSVTQAMPAFALMVWVLVYSPVLESTGGTLGKRLMRIQLIDLESRELPQFRLCMGRTWVYLIFVILSFFPVTLSSSQAFDFIVLAFGPAALSCIAFFFSDYHQTWHDKITGMICVKKSAVIH